MQNFGILCMPGEKRKRPVRSQKKEHQRDIWPFCLLKEAVLLGVCCRMPGSRHTCTLVTPCLCVCLHLAFPDMYALSVCWFETYKPRLPVYRMSSYGTHDCGLLYSHVTTFRYRLNALRWLAEHSYRSSTLAFPFRNQLVQRGSRS